MLELQNGAVARMVDPGKYQLEFMQLDVYPDWIPLNKRSEEFEVKADEVVYIGKIEMHVYHPGWKEMLKDSTLWLTAATSSITGVIGHSVKVDWRIIDNGEEFRKIIQKRLSEEWVTEHYHVNLVKKFTDRPLFG